MKSRYSILLVATIASISSVAQPSGYYNDALLFSQTNAFGATARMQALGGAQVSLGGDISAAGINPAGLGFFNRSVFSITPSATFHNTEGIYDGRIVGSYQPNVNLPNMGVVLNHTIGDIPANKFKGGSFAISVTRINDFNQQFNYEGFSANTSVVDAFLINAGTTPSNNLPESEFGAFSTFLIDPDDVNNISEYRANVGVQPFQSESVITSGGQNQLNFSWGGNYGDKIYFGAGLGVQTLNYQRRRFYSESQFLTSDGAGGLVSDTRINSVTISDELNINGTGLNGTFGMIIRPVNFITIGASYTTPTYFSLRDESGFTTTANWNNFQYNDETILNTESYVSDILISNYNLKTPGRLNLGASVFLGKRGFISGNVEFVDHGAALLQSNNAEIDLNADNQEIVTQFGSVINYRVGGEFRLEDFRFRGGYNYMGDPFNSGDFDRSRSFATFGVGFRQKDFFVDLAVVQSLFDQYYSPYELPDVADQPIIQVKNENTSISVTFGLNF